MGRELELKYRADEAQIAAIRQEYGPFHDITMETTYYDTPQRLMASRRETLRRRYENGVAVFALKTYLPDGSHGEWETEAPSFPEAMEKLRAMGAPNLPDVDTLVSICGAAFTRSCCLIAVEGGKIELALDQGVLTGSGKEIPLREVELELKEGPDEALLAFAPNFAARFALTEEPLSKFARAKAL